MQAYNEEAGTQSSTSAFIQLYVFSLSILLDAAGEQLVLDVLSPVLVLGAQHRRRASEGKTKKRQNNEKRTGIGSGPFNEAQRQDAQGLARCEGRGIPP